MVCRTRRRERRETAEGPNPGTGRAIARGPSRRDFRLLGPNGAGKSTTVGVLTTRVRPPSGQAWIGEHDVWKEQARVKHLIGVVPQRPNLDFSLTAREILVFHGAYFGIGSRQRNERADELLEKFKLTDRGESDGAWLLRRHDAAAFHCPRHDARSAGPVSRRTERGARSADPASSVGDHSRISPGGKTILLTTHNMEEADALCQRLAIIDHGHVIAQGTPEELKASIPGGYLLRLRFGNQTRGTAPAPAVTGRRARSASRGQHGVDVYADRGGSLIPEIASLAATVGGRTVGRSHLRAKPGKSVPAPHRKELARLNWKTFFAMLARDAHVARRNAVQLFLQTFLQPLLFVFVFGRVMVGSGLMPAATRACCCPASSRSAWCSPESGRWPCRSSPSFS